MVTSGIGSHPTDSYQKFTCAKIQTINDGFDELV
jgi:hypothetical protein